ncbi:ATP synthase subunit b, mitochondrial-like [Vanessa cardui]|uniref:ATP synthase subunit b, mitochondrial-like n=1 Tax=Vanessa cardui TaxID=171605 RepID=UPI001F1451CC|nr:ATP synthase subunit b, mitochondrial-like [Vanessa cardui]
MIFRPVLKLGYLKQFLKQPLVLTYTKTCQPESTTKPVCPCSSGGTTSGTISIGLKRAPKPGIVRLGFLPDEWFLFFYPKTGVTGPYVFGLVLTNYLLSKEIYVLEHEYYVGLSIALMLYYASTRLGPDLASSLDKNIDEYVEALEKERRAEACIYENAIKEAKDAQWRAEGQKLLMDAKKENIAMQLEAIYRERFMQVFRAVKGRLDYQVKLQRSLNRIHQKWMIKWILENVKKSITPDFEKAVLNKAIQDIAALSSKT